MSNASTSVVAALKAYFSKTAREATGWDACCEAFSKALASMATVPKRKHETLPAAHLAHVLRNQGRWQEAVALLAVLGHHAVKLNSAKKALEDPTFNASCLLAVLCNAPLETELDYSTRPSDKESSIAAVIERAPSTWAAAMQILPIGWHAMDYATPGGVLALLQTLRAVFRAGGNAVAWNEARAALAPWAASMRTSKLGESFTPAQLTALEHFFVATEGDAPPASINSNGPATLVPDEAHMDSDWVDSVAVGDESFEELLAKINEPAPSSSTAASSPLGTAGEASDLSEELDALAWRVHPRHFGEERVSAIRDANVQRFTECVLNASPEQAVAELTSSAERVATLKSVAKVAFPSIFKNWFSAGHHKFIVMLAQAICPEPAKDMSATYPTAVVPIVVASLLELNLLAEAVDLAMQCDWQALPDDARVDVIATLTSVLPKGQGVDADTIWRLVTTYGCASALPASTYVDLAKAFIRLVHAGNSNASRQLVLVASAELGALHAAGLNAIDTSATGLEIKESLSRTHWSELVAMATAQCRKSPPRTWVDGQPSVIELLLHIARDDGSRSEVVSSFSSALPTIRLDKLGTTYDALLEAVIREEGASPLIHGLMHAPVFPWATALRMLTKTIPGGDPGQVNELRLQTINALVRVASTQQRDRWLDALLLAATLRRQMDGPSTAAPPAEATPVLGTRGQTDGYATARARAADVIKTFLAERTATLLPLSESTSPRRQDVAAAIAFEEMNLLAAQGQWQAAAELFMKDRALLRSVAEMRPVHPAIARLPVVAMAALDRLTSIEDTTAHNAFIGARRDGDTREAAAQAATAVVAGLRDSARPLLKVAIACGDTRVIEAALALWPTPTPTAEIEYLASTIRSSIMRHRIVRGLSPLGDQARRNARALLSQSGVLPTDIGAGALELENALHQFEEPGGALQLFKKVVGFAASNQSVPASLAIDIVHRFDQRTCPMYEQRDRVLPSPLSREADAQEKLRAAREVHQSFKNIAPRLVREVLSMVPLPDVPLVIAACMNFHTVVENAVRFHEHGVSVTCGAERSPRIHLVFMSTAAMTLAANVLSHQFDAEAMGHAKGFEAIAAVWSKHVNVATALALGALERPQNVTVRTDQGRFDLPTWNIVSALALQGWLAYVRDWQPERVSRLTGRDEWVCTRLLSPLTQSKSFDTTHYGAMIPAEYAEEYATIVTTLLPVAALLFQPGSVVGEESTTLPSTVAYVCGHLASARLSAELSLALPTEVGESAPPATAAPSAVLFACLVAIGGTGSVFQRPSKSTALRLVSMAAAVWRWASQHGGRDWASVVCRLVLSAASWFTIQDVRARLNFDVASAGASYFAAGAGDDADSWKAVAEAISVPDGRVAPRRLLDVAGAALEELTRYTQVAGIRAEFAAQAVGQAHSCLLHRFPPIVTVDDSNVDAHADAEADIPSSAWDRLIANSSVPPRALATIQRQLIHAFASAPSLSVRVPIASLGLMLADTATETLHATKIWGYIRERYRAGSVAAVACGDDSVQRARAKYFAGLTESEVEDLMLRVADNPLASKFHLAIAVIRECCAAPCLEAITVVVNRFRCESFGEARWAFAKVAWHACRRRELSELTPLPDCVPTTPEPHVKRIIARCFPREMKDEIEDVFGRVKRRVFLERHPKTCATFTSDCMSKQPSDDKFTPEPRLITAFRQGVVERVVQHGVQSAMRTLYPFAIEAAKLRYGAAAALDAARVEPFDTYRIATAAESEVKKLGQSWVTALSIMDLEPNARDTTAAAILAARHSLPPKVLLHLAFKKMTVAGVTRHVLRPSAIRHVSYVVHALHGSLPAVEHGLIARDAGMSVLHLWENEGGSEAAVTETDDFVKRSTFTPQEYAEVAVTGRVSASYVRKYILHTPLPNTMPTNERWKSRCAMAAQAPATAQTSRLIDRLRAEAPTDADGVVPVDAVSTLWRLFVEWDLHVPHDLLSDSSASTTASGEVTQAGDAAVFRELLRDAIRVCCATNPGTQWPVLAMLNHFVFAAVTHNESASAAAVTQSCGLEALINELSSSDPAKSSYLMTTTARIFSAVMQARAMSRYADNYHVAHDGKPVTAKLGPCVVDLFYSIPFAVLAAWSRVEEAGVSVRLPPHVSRSEWREACSPFNANDENVVVQYCSDPRKPIHARRFVLSTWIQRLLAPADIRHDTCGHMMAVISHVARAHGVFPSARSCILLFDALDSHTPPHTVVQLVKLRDLVGMPYNRFVIEAALSALLPVVQQNPYAPDRDALSASIPALVQLLEWIVAQRGHQGFVDLSPRLRHRLIACFGPQIFHEMFRCKVNLRNTVERPGVGRLMPSWDGFPSHTRWFRLPNEGVLELYTTKLIPLLLLEVVTGAKRSVGEKPLVDLTTAAKEIGLHPIALTARKVRAALEAAVIDRRTINSRAFLLAMEAFVTAKAPMEALHMFVDGSFLTTIQAPMLDAAFVAAECALSMKLVTVDSDSFRYMCGYIARAAVHHGPGMSVSGVAAMLRLSRINAVAEAVRGSVASFLKSLSAADRAACFALVGMSRDITDPALLNLIGPTAVMSAQAAGREQYAHAVSLVTLFRNVAGFYNVPTIAKKECVMGPETLVATANHLCVLSHSYAEHFGTNVALAMQHASTSFNAAAKLYGQWLSLLRGATPRGADANLTLASPGLPRSAFDTAPSQAQAAVTASTLALFHAAERAHSADFPLWDRALALFTANTGKAPRTLLDHPKTALAVSRFLARCASSSRSPAYSLMEKALGDGSNANVVLGIFAVLNRLPRSVEWTPRFSIHVLHRWLVLVRDGVHMSIRGSHFPDPVLTRALHASSRCADLADMPRPEAVADCLIILTRHIRVHLGNFDHALAVFVNKLNALRAPLVALRFYDQILSYATSSDEAVRKAASNFCATHPAVAAALQTSVKYGYVDAETREAAQLALNDNQPLGRSIRAAEAALDLRSVMQAVEFLNDVNDPNAALEVLVARPSAAIGFDRVLTEEFFKGEPYLVRRGAAFVALALSRPDAPQLSVSSVIFALAFMMSQVARRSGVKPLQLPLSEDPLPFFVTALPQIAQAVFRGHVEDAYQRKLVSLFADAEILLLDASEDRVTYHSHLVKPIAEAIAATEGSTSTILPSLAVSIAALCVFMDPGLASKVLLRSAENQRSDEASAAHKKEMIDFVIPTCRSILAIHGTEIGVGALGALTDCAEKGSWERAIILTRMWIYQDHTRAKIQPSHVQQLLKAVDSHSDEEVLRVFSRLARVVPSACLSDPSVTLGILAKMSRRTLLQGAAGGEHDLFTVYSANQFLSLFSQTEAALTRPHALGVLEMLARQRSSGNAWLTALNMAKLHPSATVVAAAADVISRVKNADTVWSHSLSVLLKVVRRTGSVAITVESTAGLMCIAARSNDRDTLLRKVVQAAVLVRGSALALAHVTSLAKQRMQWCADVVSRAKQCKWQDSLMFVVETMKKANLEGPILTETDGAAADSHKEHSMPWLMDPRRPVRADNFDRRAFTSALSANSVATHLGHLTDFVSRLTQSVIAGEAADVGEVVSCVLESCLASGSVQIPREYAHELSHLATAALRTPLVASQLTSAAVAAALFRVLQATADLQLTDHEVGLVTAILRQRQDSIAEISRPLREVLLTNMPKEQEGSRASSFLVTCLRCGALCSTREDVEAMAGLFARCALAEEHYGTLSATIETVCDGDFDQYVTLLSACLPVGRGSMIANMLRRAALTQSSVTWEAAITLSATFVSLPPTKEEMGPCAAAGAVALNILEHANQREAAARLANALPFIAATDAVVFKRLTP